jgi:hypothetical protein
MSLRTDMSLDMPQAAWNMNRSKTLADANAKHQGSLDHAQPVITWELQGRPVFCSDAGRRREYQLCSRRRSRRSSRRHRYGHRSGWRQRWSGSSCGAAGSSGSIAVGRQSIESRHGAATELHAPEPPKHNAFNAKHHFKRSRCVASERRGSGHDRSIRAKVKKTGGPSPPWPRHGNLAGLLLLRLFTLFSYLSAGDLRLCSSSPWCCGAGLQGVDSVVARLLRLRSRSMGAWISTVWRVWEARRILRRLKAIMTKVQVFCSSQ